MSTGEFQPRMTNDRTSSDVDAIALARQNRDNDSPLFPQDGQPDFTQVSRYNKALLAAGVSREEIRGVTVNRSDPRHILAMNVLGGVISSKEAQTSGQWDDTPTSEFSVAAIHDELNRHDESHNRARANWDNLIANISDELRGLSTTQLEHVRGIVSSMNKGGY